MVSFPVELWHKIFDNLDRPESIAVASTCRTFRSIVRPSLYEKLNADLDELDKHPLTETAFALRVMRSRDPELAGFVKHFTLELLRETEYSSIPDEIRHSLHLFVNLRSLCLSLIHIDHGFCDLVAVLPRLNRVCYVSCDVAPSLIEDTEKTLADSRITDVTIADPSDGDGWLAVMPSNPRFLDINCISVEGGEDIVFSIFDDLMDFGQNESLEVFIFRECPFPSNMVDFLKSCHQLRRIELPKIPIALVDSFDNFPGNTLTHLEHFSGHAKDAGIFIKGRPIHTAELTLNSKTPVDALQALGQSTVPVTRLILKARNLTPEHLQYAPTTLRQLDLDRVTDTSWMSTLSRFPDIQILTMSNFRMSRDRQAAVVRDASVVCMSLRKIVFDPPREFWFKRGKYRWRWMRDGPWELYTDW